MTACFVYITVPDADAAHRIGRALVELRLAASVNLIESMRSVFRWQGEVQEEDETVLIAKTQEALVPALTEKVRSLHSYECPCIAALPVAGGNRDYLVWIAAETGPEG